MAAFGVDIEPIRKGGQQRGLVTGFRVSWWRKDEAELKEAYRELNQPKVGRMARLRHEVDQIEFNATAPSPSLKEKIDATVAAMRAGGAPEEDIDAFVKSQAA
ncbi:MAG TPA: hypothetical protein VFW94_09815 [Candidatus Acidoferrales bacterium]|nr:hypothetical protein [Candidatus Acidoferrales bacterium]